MDNREKEHLLALKVMRLTRPSLCTTVPIFTEPNDLNHDHFERRLKEDIAAPMNLSDFNCGNLLILPQSFGNIYLGETFSCYMSVHNDSNNTVKNVSVQADLQIGPQKLMLTSQRENSCLITELKPNESVDDVIHHEVKEIGTHILACTVNYTTDHDEKMYFRKFFKFQVSKPLDVKTKFYNAESSEVYLEAQLQNITSSPMCLEKVVLESSANFVAHDLNSTSNNDCNQVFGSISCLNPLDSRQYLFCLTPRNESQKNTKFLKGVTGIGKLDIVWHTNMGERGHLQTSQLERIVGDLYGKFRQEICLRLLRLFTLFTSPEAPTYGDIKLSVEEIPSIVCLEKSFVISCRLTNTCERPLNLMLTMINTPTSGIQWQGISGRCLKTLDPQCSIDLQLIALPIRTGLLMISGIRLTDTFLKRTYDHDDLAQVFVCNNFKSK